MPGCCADIPELFIWCPHVAVAVVPAEMQQPVDTHLRSAVDHMEES